MTEMIEGMRFLKQIQNNYHAFAATGMVREIFRSDSTISYPQSVMIPFRARTSSVPSYDSSGSRISLI